MVDKRAEIPLTFKGRQEGGNSPDMYVMVDKRAEIPLICNGQESEDSS